MNNKLRKISDAIIQKSIKSVLPEEAVRKAMAEIQFQPGKIILVAVGKAAYAMAKESVNCYDQIDKGIVITKYQHVKGKLKHIDCYEAGHPVPDQNGYTATEKTLEMVQHLKENDNVLFLLSGGGSALFERPKITLRELQYITEQLLSCGADITEINTVRKHLSYVKGGNFAKICYPAHVYSIILSDVIGNPLDTIASGPAYPDSTTSEEALKILQKYKIEVSDEAISRIQEETPKELSNVTTYITGSVKDLCENAKSICESMGYETEVLTDCLDTEAKEAGRFLGSIALTHCNEYKKMAFIAGGETIVHIHGSGKGGRNQELALSAADVIKGKKNVAVFSVGSDGTDGPTDAAGGYVDGYTFDELKNKGISINEVLMNNDSYNALKASNGLIITGPTGTNVNDLCVILIN